MNRRDFLRTAAVSAGAGTLRNTLMAEQNITRNASHQIGIATTSYMSYWRPTDTLEFLEHCATLGAAGIQAPLHGDLRKLRSRAEQLGMYIEAMVTLPHGDDTAAFEESLRQANEVGAVALRSACLGTRRYETFSTLDEWRTHVADSKKSLHAAVPLLEKYRIPLGIENHKDWTVDEMVDVLREHSSEFLGVCLDFGNNISLLDNPMDVIEKLVPFTVTTHLKNMAVEPYEQGFLLSEVLLGTGYLDLAHVISLIRNARPKARFLLEMITRDPLKVPCLTDKYWVTFPDRNGIYLARTLTFVEAHKPSQPLPRFSQLTHEEQLRAENQNVIECLGYAHQTLGL